MTTTVRRTLAFAHAFTLAGVDGTLPPGDYQVELDCAAAPEGDEEPRVIGAFLYVRRGGRSFAFEVEADELSRIHAEDQRQAAARRS